MEKRKSQPSPPLQQQPRVATFPPPPTPHHQPPPLPNHCCGNYEKFKEIKRKLTIENFNHLKLSLEKVLLPRNIDEQTIQINLYWYKIKANICSFDLLRKTLENERPSLHYILIQGFSRHHLFILEELSNKITLVFKKKREKRSLLYSIEETCIRSNRYGKCIIAHMDMNVNQLIFLELLSKTRNPHIFIGILNSLESAYINHTCII